jgi:hypothetical protein
MPASGPSEKEPGGRGGNTNVADACLETADVDVESSDLHDRLLRGDAVFL